MRFAVIANESANGVLQKDAYVENVIELEEKDRELMVRAMGKLLLNAEPLGLGPGDLYTGSHWVRSVEDEEIVLPIAQE